MDFVSSRRKAIWTLLAAAALSQAAGLADFQGTWKIDRKRSQNVSEAIDDAVEPLNFVVRSVARTRLQKTNQPGATLAIALTDGNTSIDYGNKKTVVTPSDGKPVPWGQKESEPAEVSTRLTGSALVQTFKANDGQKTNRFLLSPDGKELVLETQVASPRLSKPLSYRTVYRREP